VTLIYVYRGDFCPFARFELADLTRHADELRRARIAVVGISADPIDRFEDAGGFLRTDIPLLSDTSEDGAGRRSAWCNTIVNGEPDNAIPALFIVDREGVVRWIFTSPYYRELPTVVTLLDAAQRSGSLGAADSARGDPIISGLVRVIGEARTASRRGGGGLRLAIRQLGLRQLWRCLRAGRDREQFAARSGVTPPSAKTGIAARAACGCETSRAPMRDRLRGFEIGSKTGPKTAKSAPSRRAPATIGGRMSRYARSHHNVQGSSFRRAMLTPIESNADGRRRRRAAKAISTRKSFTMNGAPWREQISRSRSARVVEFARGDILFLAVAMRSFRGGAIFRAAASDSSQADTGRRFLRLGGR